MKSIAPRAIAFLCATTIAVALGACGKSADAGRDKGGAPAHGAGSASRRAIGVVVVSGVLLSTLLSLFVIPTFYLLVARFTHSPQERTHIQEKLDTDVASVDRSHGG